MYVEDLRRVPLADRLCTNGKYILALDNGESLLFRGPHDLPRPTSRIYSRVNK